ncbi:benzoate/H(+) symporter BenE family transporter [Kocuria atrinae]|uniref:Benzoate/H(+) symporter BenE family transporter n=1 Tax=Kocuria atrinae TaxID=592377 RepID=A0ABP5JTG7_9MICC|nr:benzoate/H(+) symporter BenE family transporter [Kocuria sp.]
MSTAPRPSRDTPRNSLGKDWSLSATLAGFVAVVVSYAGPLLVVLEAARAAGLSTEQTASWVWAISVGSGITCVLCSWWFRQPVMVAWSIPGAALLITSLGNFSFSDAIGAYIVTAVLGLILGVTGWFGKILDAIPKPITAAVLAGVLLPFSIQVAPSVVENPAPAGALVIGYLLGKRFLPRYAVFVAMGLGVGVAWLTGAINSVSPDFRLTVPEFTMPTFSWAAIAGISIPLLIVTAAGQNAPGLAMMKTADFPPNDRALLGASGIASIIFAPFGSHALNLAAVTAGIATSPEAHPEHRRRYVAGIACGAFYILFGAFASTIVTLFSAIPPGLISALAGVALLGALQGSMFDSMHQGNHQPAVIEAALITLVVTVSGIQPFGIVSAFWGILVGVVAFAILRRRPR